MNRKSHNYVAEFNRPKGDSILIWMEILRSYGLSVYRLQHKTAVIIKRPAKISWATFKLAIQKSLQKRKGSAVISSCSTGRVYLCDNKGNLPGVFQIVASP